MKLPKEYYPTPEHLASKMVHKVDWKQIVSVLEPSAGDGNLVIAAARQLMLARNKYVSSVKDFDYSDIDVIEIEENFQTILRNKGVKVVYDEFLAYRTYKQYDLIIMNPPFSNGDKHLLKALDMQKRGGQIVCLLNAETLKNPCTNTRTDLVKRLTKYNASIEYIENAFTSADRKTSVEVALIHVNIPDSYDDCEILQGLEKATEDITEQSDDAQVSTALESFLNAIVLQYEAETAAGVKLIREYLAFSPKCLNTFSDKYPNQILEVKIYGKECKSNNLINDFLKRVRYKYWEALFGRKELYNLMTNAMRQQYYNRLDELKHYEFNLHNIKQIQLELSQHKTKSVEQTILDLFDKFARDHSWYKECSNNVHYYDGWATNKVGIINKKVIIPLNAFDRYDNRFSPRYSVIGEISDIEKVFNYLDGGITPDIESVDRILEIAQNSYQTAKIDFKYFKVTFYKKGTTHIEFKDMDLLKKFNIYAGRKRGGLPPAYGKKPYSDMSVKEKQVIDNFEGEAEYNKVYKNKELFILETENLLMLENSII